MPDTGVISNCCALSFLRRQGSRVVVILSFPRRRNNDTDPGARTRIDAVNIALNEPRELRAIAPTTAVAGKQYCVVVSTQASAKNGTHLLKNMREMKSDFTITVQ